MSAGANPTAVSMEVPVLQFARAFRSAARVVGFYPPAHPAVGSSLDLVVAAARAVATRGPLALTILPDVFLVGGEPLESREGAIAELASILHRHGVGALNLRGSAGNQAWRALFELLAQTPEDIRDSGGIQRRWLALRHPDPVILEIDFGEMLRGRVGGDFGELAGVINHYLETAGVGSSFAEDPYAVLLAALERAGSDDAAVTALVEELRTGVQLIRMTQADRFDELLRDAARIGEHLSESQMARLLGERGKSGVLVGTVDVVASLVERMSDTTVAKFLAAAMSFGDRASERLIEVFTAIVPDPLKRTAIVPVARQNVAANVSLEPGSLSRWTDLEQQLEALSDRQFVSDAYARELATAKRRSEEAARMSQDPPERVAAWVQSLDDGVVDELDLRLLEDLARIERGPDQFRDVLSMLLGRIYEAADGNDWITATRVVTAMQGVTRNTADNELKAVAAKALQVLHESSACEKALGALGVSSAPVPVAQINFILAIGPTLIPRLVRRWMASQDSWVRLQLESVLGEFGREGREALRRMLTSSEAGVKTAAIRLLADASATDHLASMEALLSDPDLQVRHEALVVLASSPSDRAHEVLARGIAGTGPDQQPVLIGEVVAMGGVALVPVLRRLVSYLDQNDVDPRVYLAVIDGLRQAGGPDAAAALRLVSERSSWRTPLRTMKFRAAARHALRSIAAAASAGRGGV